jgi:hypothetical protein
MSATPPQKHFTEENAPAMRPAVIPPVSVGRPAAAVGHETRPGFVVFNVWLIGYVSFELELSPSIGAGELPVVALRAEIFAWGRVLATGCSKKRKVDCV